MRKLWAVVFALLLTAGASATTIESESLTLDLETSEATAEIKVGELTSSSFTYITSANVDSVSATANSRELDCTIETLTLGDEIVCDTDLRDNFTVELEYDFSGLVTNGDELKTFRYSHPIYRPTQEFNLRVELPEGAGIAQEASDNPITPADGSVGSDGRTIYIEWSKTPQIGDTLNFRVDYENLSSSEDYAGIVIGLLAGVLLVVVGYMYWKRRNTESLDTIYPDLSDDQREIVELLEENGGEMLQKDVVNSSDYSKAKISGLVSELVDEEVVEKKKEGRSNKLKISSKYKF